MLAQKKQLVQSQELSFEMQSKIFDLDLSPNHKEYLIQFFDLKSEYELLNMNCDEFFQNLFETQHIGDDNKAAILKFKEFQKFIKEIFQNFETRYDRNDATNESEIEYFKQFNDFLEEQEKDNNNIIHVKMFRMWQIKQWMRVLSQNLNVSENIILQGNLQLNSQKLSEQQKKILQDYANFYRKNIVDSQQNEIIHKNGSVTHKKYTIDEKNLLCRLPREYNYFNFNNSGSSFEQQLHSDNKFLSDLRTKLVNTYNSIMNLEFNQRFNNFFQCAGCLGVNNKPPLYYCAYKNDQKKAFCSCILCNDCCRATLSKVPARCCCCEKENQYFENPDDLRPVPLQILPIISYHALKFQKISFEQASDPANIELTRLYTQQMKNKADWDRADDIYVASNLKDSNLQDSMTQFVQILDYFHLFVNTFRDLISSDDIWFLHIHTVPVDKIKKVNRDPETQKNNLERKINKFKDDVCVEYFNLLYNNGLVSTLEMKQNQHFVFPNNDRDNQGRYEDIKKNNNMWSHCLIRQLFDFFKNAYQKGDKNISLSNQGIDNLYKKFILQ